MLAGLLGQTLMVVFICEYLFGSSFYIVLSFNPNLLNRADYLTLDGTINWQTFNDSQFDLCTGITLYHCPGHTPGLCIMQVNLKRDGTFIWTTDQYHVKENFESNWAHGWLLRDYRSWVDSGKFIRRLQRVFSAKLIFGHDFATAEELINCRDYHK